MKRITYVKPVSLGHFGALVGVCFGILLAAGILVDLLVTDALAGRLSLPPVFKLAMGAGSYALIGWPLGFLVGHLFNRLAPRVGGLEVGFTDPK